MPARLMLVALAALPVLVAFAPMTPPTARRADHAALLAVLDTAMQDEHFARSVYERVLRDHGQVMPFANIVLAEQRHAEHIAALFTAYGAAVPAAKWTADAVPAFASISAACMASIKAEEANITMYDRLLADSIPADVRAVFVQNRWASVERHLPAFQRCVARNR